MSPEMAKAALRKEKWTLSFDRELKARLIKAARRRGVYRVTLLEEIVRERFNPYGHTDIIDSTEYVAAVRKPSRKQTDEALLPLLLQRGGTTLDVEDDLVASWDDCDSRT